MLKGHTHIGNADLLGIFSHDHDDAIIDSAVDAIAIIISIVFAQTALRRCASDRDLITTSKSIRERRLRGHVLGKLRRIACLVNVLERDGDLSVLVFLIGLEHF